MPDRRGFFKVSSHERQVIGALGSATVVGVLAAPWLLAVIAPGFTDPAQRGLAVVLTRVMFPYLLLVGAAAFAMGVLNSQGRFFAAALGPAVLNVGMIVGVLVLARRVDPPIMALALGVLLGGVGQLLVQVPGLKRLGLLVSPSRELRHPALGRVSRLLLPAVFGLAAVQVMVFVNTLLASLLPAGSISFLYYADRVIEFPLGIFAAALMRPMGHAGLAAASSLGAYVNLLALLWAARRRFGLLGGRALAASVARTAVACVPLGAWCLLALAAYHRMDVVTTGRIAAGLTVTIVIGAGLFWVTSALLGSSERGVLLAMVRRRGARAA